MCECDFRSRSPAKETLEPERRPGRKTTTKARGDAPTRRGRACHMLRLSQAWDTRCHASRPPLRPANSRHLECRAGTVAGLAEGSWILNSQRKTVSKTRRAARGYPPCLGMSSLAECTDRYRPNGHYPGGGLPKATCDGVTVVIGLFGADQSETQRN